MPKENDALESTQHAKTDDENLKISQLSIQPEQENFEYNQMETIEETEIPDTLVESKVADEKDELTQGLDHKIDENVNNDVRNVEEKIPVEWIVRKSKKAFI